jgi:hypothetical protein
MPVSVKYGQSELFCYMKYTIILICFLQLLLHSVNAQNSTLKGMLSDSINHENLPNAVVSVLRSKDSVLIKATRTQNNGSFIITGLQPGTVIIKISYIGFVPFADWITLPDNATRDMGTIYLIPAVRLLQEVIVRQRINAIRIKGDTIEFKADSFRVAPYATVEDLLKKLPGLEVNSKGEIKAQGQKVQKILVDGEEFFGDDPTLVTQNLRANIVDKVQLFDKKSDQAVFTGIDDGKKTKTINLTIKEDKKNGYFGKLATSAGNSGYHDSKLLFNKFTNKEKLSLYGIVSNIGTTGLNWNETATYAIGGTTGIENPGADVDTWDGNYNGHGFPLVQTGGVHYDSKWGDKKNSINLNYKTQQLFLTGAEDQNAEYISPSLSYFSTQHQSYNNKILRNKFDGTYEFQIDSVSSVKIDIGASQAHKRIDNKFLTETDLESGIMLNNGRRNITGKGDYDGCNANILWRKRFAKKGRTLSINLLGNYSHAGVKGYLYAANNFYSVDSSTAQTELVDQYKTSRSNLLNINTQIIYTEPISSHSNLMFTTTIDVTNNSSEKNSFNKAPDGKYNLPDGPTSNNYTFNISSQRGGLNYSFIKKNIRMAAGTDISFTRLKQKDIIADTIQKRYFTDWYPSANFNYIPNQTTSVGFSYNGNTIQPTIQQIQPVYQTTDPLNIAIGNPGLRPSFSHNFQLVYIKFNPLNNRNLWVDMSYHALQNAISSMDSIDAAGRRKYQYVNVSGVHNLSANINYSFKWKNPDLNIGINSNFTNSQNINIVNNEKNKTTNYNFQSGLSAGKYKDKKYNFEVNGSASYTKSVSTIGQQFKIHYWIFNIRQETDIYLPHQFQLHQDGSYLIREKTDAFTAPSTIIWNAWLGKRLLKDNSLLIRFSVNDILNQNTGIDRFTSSNYISQNSYSVIKRYFLLSLVWDFTKQQAP